MVRIAALRPIVALLVLAFPVPMAPLHAQDVLGETGTRGAGSTFVYPVLSKWSREYRAALARGGDFPMPNGGLDDPPASSALEYEPVGSLAGTLRVKDRAVDFGVSEMPLRSDELAQLGLAQFPLVMGGIVVAVNIDGVEADRLKLSGIALADIYLGKIARWSDKSLAALNPGVRLPDAPIDVIHRSDGSGSTFHFTAYLSGVSAEWKLRAGSALIVRWPVGSGAKGNEGVALAVKGRKNSIGYVEYAQARQVGLSPALLANRAGKFIRAEPAAFAAAALSAHWSAENDFHLLLTDAAGDQAYPLTATVFVLMHTSASRARTRAALDFFRWSLEKGSRAAADLGYVPLPPALVADIRAYWSRRFKGAT